MLERIIASVKISKLQQGIDFYVRCHGGRYIDAGETEPPTGIYAGTLLGKLCRKNYLEEFYQDLRFKYGYDGPKASARVFSLLCLLSENTKYLRIKI